MTFGEMRQALWDRLGLTGEQTMIERLINSGKDRFVTAYKWPYLETSTDQLFTSGTRSYTAPTDCRHILSLHGPSGTPLDGDISREEYDLVFRGDTSTATVPTVFREQGAVSTTQRIQFHVWPNPTTNTTGSMRYLTRPADILTTGTNSVYDYIPAAHHFAIVDAAEASFAEYEERQDAPTLWQKFYQTVATLAGVDVEALPGREND